MDRKYIQALIGKGDLDSALHQMSQSAPNASADQNAIISLSSRLSGLNRQKMLGVISTRDASEELARIREGVLGLLDILIPADTASQKKRTILFLGASPKDLDVLRITEENQKIKDTLSSASSRDNFLFESEMAVQIQTMTKALQKFRPAIVHFSGHGSGADGLSLEDVNGEEVLYPTAGLDRLFRIVDDHVECVLLNACYASEQAKVISNHNIYVVGMNNAILDEVSIQFTLGFYQSLGEGKSYEQAFDFGMVNIAHFIQDANTPELWKAGNKIG